MQICKFCKQEGLDWFQVNERWKLGIQIDTNNFRVHICTPQKTESSNKRNWAEFICISCNSRVARNLKLNKDLNYCSDCTNYV